MPKNSVVSRLKIGEMLMNRSIGEMVTIRPQMIKDARGFYDILTGGAFQFFPVNVASIEAEKRFLRKDIRQWRAGEAWNFSIMLGDRLIGAIGIMPEDSRPYNAEIGYFIDRELHGKGYTLQAVRLAEQFVLTCQPQIHRLYACMVVDNVASARVVEKAGFLREGRLSGYLKVGKTFHDAFVYGKVIGSY